MTCTTTLPPDRPHRSQPQQLELQWKLIIWEANLPISVYSPLLVSMSAENQKAGHGDIKLLCSRTTSPLILRWRVSWNELTQMLVLVEVSVL
jgi:hypothetical protein